MTRSDLSPRPAAVLNGGARRLSLQGVTALAVLGFALTAAVFGFVIYRGIENRTRTLDIVSEETASLKLYEELRSSGFAESAAAALYLGVRSQEFLDRFDEARAQVESSIGSLKQSAATEEAAQLQIIEDLEEDHAELAETYDLILAALQDGDEATGLEIAEERQLGATARLMWDRLDRAIVDARDEALAAQQRNGTTQRSLDRAVAAMAAVWTLLMVGAGFGVYRWVVRPLRRVAGAARGVAQGNMQARSPIAGPREVASLAASVNWMADSLIERSDQLRAYLSKNLEARSAELEEANNALQSSEQKFRSLVQNAPDLITVVDPGTRVLYQSPSIQPVLGYETDELIGKPLADLVHEEDRSAFLAFFHHLVTRPGETFHVETRLRHANGTWRILEIYGSDRSQDSVVRLVLNSRDVTERIHLEEELRYRAFHDSLTGLANRASFADRLEHALARARRRPAIVGVLFIDLDSFKAINDSFGHSAGDACLRGFGERLRSCLRPGDTAARVGGDEFAVLLEDLLGPDAAQGIAERVLDALQTPFSYAGQEVFVRASIGIAIADAVSEGQLASEGIMRQADIAMYAAKQGGKSCYELYDEALHLSLIRRFELLGELLAAVDHGEFFVQYQPTVQLASGRIIGLEALVRWQNPRHGVVLPEDFIPLAEESGVILTLGHWVLEEACRQMTKWSEDLGDHSLWLSVNVSVRQILHPGFVDEVRGVLEETGLEPSRLILEITESITMQATNATIRALQQLKRLGIRLAIDDFGMGSSSLSYLQKFPFDIVKIDKTFIRDTSNRRSERELTRKVIELGKVLRLEVIAEGIERGDQLAELQDLDCAIGQGYLFARPLDASDVVGLLRQGTAREAA